jgi:hypothetical protein
MQRFAPLAFFLFYDCLSFVFRLRLMDLKTKETANRQAIAAIIEGML